MIRDNYILRHGKKIILYGFFLFLFIPLIQKLTHFKRYIFPLDGAFYPARDTTFSWEGWFSGDYQYKKDGFIKENFGLRNYYVRLNCQVNFSLFKKSGVSYVVVGKDNYLYETAYMDAYYGRDFIGKRKIVDYIKKIAKVQDTMEKLNKLIFISFAPGKACFYPENIPENYKSVKGITNYDGFITAVKSAHVNHIDFYDHFRKQKNISPYPLYPQLGIHWSDYGSLIALDSMVHYIEGKLGKDLPDLKMRRLDYSDKLKATDDDAIKSLNLFKEPRSFKMAYPEWIAQYDPKRHKKLNLLVISDSFWWYIYRTKLPDQVFNSARFWYYNKEMYPESFTKMQYVADADRSALIRQADVIMIMHAEATLPRFGGGFVDMCYEAYFSPDETKNKILEMKKTISTYPDWMRQIEEKAKKNNIPVDSMLTLDAMYVIESKKNEVK